MSRVCTICGKGAMSGHKVSHSNIKTNRRWIANVQKIEVTQPNGSKKTQYVCTRCIRTMKKASA